MDASRISASGKPRADIVSSQHTMAAAAQVEFELPLSPRRFPPEFELLIACCANNPAAIGAALSMPLRWDILFDHAEHHRLIPALYSATHTGTDVPASIQSVLRARFEQHSLRCLRLTAELARVLSALTDAGVNAIAHKGPALAQLLYGDSAMRQYGDIDVLVSRHDVPRAKLVLQQLGYQLNLQLSSRQEKAHINSANEYVFALGRERNLLELQWQILPSFYAIDFDIEEMLNRSIPLQLDGFHVRTLRREDLLLALCAHAAKHAWIQLGMLRDIAALSQFDLDWSWIKAEAERLGMMRILAISVLLTRNLVGLSPTTLSHRLELKECENAVEAIQRRLVAAEDMNTTSFPYFRQFLRARELWTDRLRFVSRLALTPSVGEWQSMRIPDSLFFSYRIVRLGRCARHIL